MMTGWCDGRREWCFPLTGRSLSQPLSPKWQAHHVVPASSPSRMGRLGLEKDKSSSLDLRCNESFEAVPLPSASGVVNDKLDVFKRVQSPHMLT
jgi:hypothetical protein